MVFVTAGVILAAVFIGWVVYKLIAKKPIQADDFVAGLFFTIVFCAVVYFLLQV